jgi:hypothetical protein
VADALAAQAGAVMTPIGVGPVALGAVLSKDDFACLGGLRLTAEGIDAGVVFVGDAMQPFAVGFGEENSRG